VVTHIPNIRSDRFAAKLLHGWWVGNIVTARTGFPFTPLVSVGRSNNAIFAGQSTTGIVDRPNLGTDTTSATFRCSGTASAFPRGTTLFERLGHLSVRSL